MSRSTALLCLTLGLGALACVTSYGDGPAQASSPADSWGLAQLCPEPGSEAERAAAAFPFPAPLVRPRETIFLWRDHENAVVEGLRADPHFSAVLLVACEGCEPYTCEKGKGCIDTEPSVRRAAAFALAREHMSPLLVLSEEAGDAYGRANPVTMILSGLTLGLLPLPQGPYEEDARLRLLLVDVERGAPLLCAEGHGHADGWTFGFEDDYWSMSRIEQKAFRQATADALAQFRSRLEALAPLP